MQWGEGGGELLKVAVTPFFFRLVFCAKRQKDEGLGTGTSGQKGQTRGPPVSREEDVRDEGKDVSSCFLLTCDD